MTGGHGWAAGRKFLLVLAALLLAILVMHWELSSHAAGEELGLPRVWSDGFFVSAVLFASVGILSLVASWGGFDTISYGAGFLAARFTRFAKVDGKDGEYHSYFDYVQAKRADREEHRSKGVGPHAIDFIITGLLMLALSACAMLAQ